MLSDSQSHLPKSRPPHTSYNHHGSYLSPWPRWPWESDKITSVWAYQILACVLPNSSFRVPSHEAASIAPRPSYLLCTILYESLMPDKHLSADTQTISLFFVVYGGSRQTWHSYYCYFRCQLAGNLCEEGKRNETTYSSLYPFYYAQHYITYRKHGKRLTQKTYI